MNDIMAVLLDKKQQLLQNGNPLLISFNVDDINILADVNKLRVFKIQNPFPKDYKNSSDVFTCANDVLHQDNLYKMLELSMLLNKVLEVYIMKVFPKLQR